MTLTESSITLDFPDDNYFRFQDCEGYKAIQHHFKEMDVCWYEQETDTLYIIELKDWKNNKLDEESDTKFSAAQIQEMKEGISKHRLNELWKKSIDSICMIMSVLMQKPYSSKIKQCATFKLSDKTKIKLISVINWIDPDVSYLVNMNTAYKSKLQSYSKLFDIKMFAVLTKKQASEKFSWIK